MNCEAITVESAPVCALPHVIALDYVLGVLDLLTRHPYRTAGLVSLEASSWRVSNISTSRSSWRRNCVAWTTALPLL